MKALVGALNQEKALTGAFSVIVQFRRWIVCSTSYRWRWGGARACSAPSAGCRRRGWRRRRWRGWPRCSPGTRSASCPSAAGSARSGCGCPAAWHKQHDSSTKNSSDIYCIYIRYWVGWRLKVNNIWFSLHFNFKCAAQLHSHCLLAQNRKIFGITIRKMVRPCRYCVGCWP